MRVSFKLLIFAVFSFCLWGSFLLIANDEDSYLVEEDSASFDITVDVPLYSIVKFQENFSSLFTLTSETGYRTFISDSFFMFFKSNAQSGYRVIVLSNDPLSQVGSDFKLRIDLNGQTYYLKFNLLSDHDSSGNPTPVSAGSGFYDPETDFGGTPLYDQSLVTTTQGLPDARSKSYNIYFHIYGDQFEELPSGFYSTNLTFQLFYY